MKRRSIIIFFSTLVIIEILITPKECINYTLSGAKLFFYSVFPSLFPFLIISNIMIGCDGIKIYSDLLGNILCTPLKLPKECSVALLISFLCGYPLGAKYSCVLYENKAIDYITFQRLLNIASNPSPLFIVSVIGTSMLNNTYLGYLLLLSSYISCFLISIFLPKNLNKNSSDTGFLFTEETKNIGVIIKESLENAISTTLYVGSFVIIFCVIINIIKNNAIFSIVIKNNLIKAIFLGLLEMTNGCYLIANLNLNIFYKVIIISFLINFSGLSVITQVYSLIYKFNINLKSYVKYKTLQGILSTVAVCLLLLPNINFH